MTNHWTKNAEVEYDPREDEVYDAARFDDCCDYVHTVTIEGRHDDLRCTRTATETREYVDPLWGPETWSLCPFHAAMFDAEKVA